MYPVVTFVNDLCDNLSCILQPMDLLKAILEEVSKFPFHSVHRYNNIQSHRHGTAFFLYNILNIIFNWHNNHRLNMW